MVRSELQPEETRGLTRSGDLARMLPFEAHLLSAGWAYRDLAKDAKDGQGRKLSRFALVLAVATAKFAVVEANLSCGLKLFCGFTSLHSLAGLRGRAACGQ